LSLAGVSGAGLFFTLASRQGLYRSWRVTPMRQELLWVLRTWGITAAVLSLLAVLAGYRLNWNAEAVVLWWFGLAPIALVLQRTLVRYVFRAIRKAGRNYRQMAILGDTPQAGRLQDKITKSAWMGLRLQGIYDDRQNATENRRVGATLEGNTDDLVLAAQCGAVDVIYITLPVRAAERIRSEIMALMDTTASVYLVPDFFVFGLMESNISYFDDIAIVTVVESPFVGIEGWAKRAEDIVLGGLIMLLIAVPMMFIALGIKVTSPGPVLFRQERYGVDGRAINVWKFRSMRVTEDGHTTFKQATKGDPRVTAFGAFLRRTSLDELPQFFNVLGGGMSIVGPRPHPIALNESFRALIPGYMLRHKVKPGITGWAQINGWRGETDTLKKMEKRVEFDLEYVRRWSVWFDMKIIFLTVFKGFAGSNAY